MYYYQSNPSVVLICKSDFSIKTTRANSRSRLQEQHLRCPRVPKSSKVQKCKNATHTSNHLTRTCKSWYLTTRMYSACERDSRSQQHVPSARNVLAIALRHRCAFDACLSRGACWWRFTAPCLACHGVRLNSRSQTVFHALVSHDASTCKLANRALHLFSLFPIWEMGACDLAALGPKGLALVAEFLARFSH